MQTPFRLFNGELNTNSHRLAINHHLVCILWHFHNKLTDIGIRIS